MIALLALSCSLGFGKPDDGKPTGTDTRSDSDPETDTDTDADSDSDSDNPAADDDGDGFSEDDGDCDDGNPMAHPDATDVVGDGIDLDCDGVDGHDADRDGYASSETGGDDCNDADAAINPAALEDTCDGRDDDCDGQADDGAECDVTVVHNDDRNCLSYNHAYLFARYEVAGWRTWDSVRDFCVDRGYDLMIVEDECEWDWAYETMYSTSTSSLEWWAGLHCMSGDCTSSDDFGWLDGSTGYVYWSGNTFAYGDECALLFVAWLDSTTSVMAARATPCDDLLQVICESTQ